MTSSHPDPAPGSSSPVQHSPVVSGGERTEDSAPSHGTESSAERGRQKSVAHILQGSKFLVVGGLVFLFDAALYNLLVFWHPVHGWGEGLMHAHPITARVITIAAASCLTYIGNRVWTYNDRSTPLTARSVIAFIVINVIASGLQIGCLGFSRYVLGLDSALADNISGTFIGQIVSTGFRFLTYGRFVFPQSGPHKE